MKEIDLLNSDFDFDFAFDSRHGSQNRVEQHSSETQAVNKK